MHAAVRLSVHALCHAHCALFPSFPSCTGVLNEKIAAIVRRQVTQDDLGCRMQAVFKQCSSSVQAVFKQCSSSGHMELADLLMHG